VVVSWAGTRLPDEPKQAAPDLRAPALTGDDVGTGRSGLDGWRKRLDGWPKRLDGWPMIRSKQRLGVPLLP
jgi:hypothetical protein